MDYPWATRPDHVFESQQFGRDDLYEITRRAKVMERVFRRGGCRDFADCQAWITFFQPSSRTFISSQVAAVRLGITVIYASDHANVFSSAVKGESLDDTIATIHYYDHAPGNSIFVLRHPEGDAARRAINVVRQLGGDQSPMHIVNAGCGKAKGQHPTQALLDVVTIHEKFGALEHLVYGVMGDLHNGRTVRSLLYHLGNCANPVKVFLFSPPSLKLGDDIKSHLIEKGVNLVEVFDRAAMIEALAEIQVLYVTRFQKEDLIEEDAARFGEYQQTFQVNRGVRERLPNESIIMHPLPHNLEISQNTTRDPRYVAMRQLQNGLFVRMALYATMLRGHEGFRRWEESLKF